MGLFLFASQANAAVILSFGTGTFEQNSGVQFVDVFARATAPETTSSFVADFTLGGARFDSPVAGTFGFAGSIGAGFLDPASSFTVDSIDPRVAYLNLDFATPQALPSVNTLIARLGIQTNAASLGTFNISADNVATPAGLGSAAAGSFTIITAVPEPTSMALVGLVFGGFAGRRAMKRFRKVA